MVMKAIVLFIFKNWKIFLPVFSLVVVLFFIIKTKIQKRRSYRLETLIKNRLGNSHTVIKKNKVL